MAVAGEGALVRLKMAVAAVAAQRCVVAQQNWLRFLGVAAAALTRQLQPVALAAPRTVAMAPQAAVPLPVVVVHRPLAVRLPLTLAFNMRVAMLPLAAMRAAAAVVSTAVVLVNTRAAVRQAAAAALAMQAI